MIKVHRAGRWVRAEQIAWGIALLLVWWGLRNVPLRAIWETVRHVDVRILGGLLLLNMGILWLFAGRWWLMLRALAHPVAYTRLVVYRLAAFSISYFTPGTQFGGEPLQVYLLVRRDHVPTTAAITSVSMDKLLEMLVNFAFLVVGVGVLLQQELVPTLSGGPLLAGAIALITLPLLYTARLCLGYLPLTSLVARTASAPYLGSLARRWHKAIHTVERQSANTCHRRPDLVLMALVLSLLTWGVLVGEYWLMARALGLYLSLGQTVAVLTAARLAFLFPLPGGLGALETGQVLAVSALGLDPAYGLSLSLLIRGRDITFGLVGLWLGKVLFSRAATRQAGIHLRAGETLVPLSASYQRRKRNAKEL